MGIRLSIRQKLSLALVAVSFTVCLFIGVCLSISIQRMMEKDFQSNKEITSRIVLTNVIPGMEFDQKDYLLQLLESLKSDDEYDFGAIFDKNGTLYTSYVRPGSTVQIPKRQEGWVAGSRYCVFRLPIFSEIQGKSGILLLGFSRSSMERHSQNLFRQLVLFFVLIALALTLGLYLVAARIVIRPMGVLASATRKIAGGDLSARATLSSDDEMGRLALDFNAMAENLQGLFLTQEQHKNEILGLQKFLNHIITNSPNGIITLDPEERVLQINPSARTILALEEDLPAQEQDLYTWIPAFSSFRDSIRTVQDTRTLVRRNRSVFPWQDGAETIVDVVMYPVPWQNRMGVVILLLDVTDQVSLERQLIQAQKMEAIGTLAGGIAHDFNNILTVILGTLSLLQYENRDPETASRLQIIEEAATRASSLVRQILVFSRKEAGESEEMDLGSVLTTSVQMGKELFPRAIRIEKDVESGDYPVRGDRNQITQVLMNLLINARDAIEQSERHSDGLIRIQLKHLSVDSGIQGFYEFLPPGHYAELRISDNGCGMDKAIVQKIFNPFFTTKGVGKGTGLGLSIVYGIIKNHSGEVKVYSEPGVGSSFAILLPLSQKGQASEQKSAPNLKFGKGKIVVVDDEESVLQSTRAILKHLGYETLGFPDGPSVLEYFRQCQDHVDLLILDIIMPKMDGYQTYLKLKEHPDLPPILFCSGFADETLLESIRKEGDGIRFLLKPFHTVDLSEVVHDILSSRETG